MSSTPRSHWEVFWPPWVPSRPLAASVLRLKAETHSWPSDYSRVSQTVSIDLRKVILICEPGLESKLSNMEVFRRFGMTLPSLTLVEAWRTFFVCFHICHYLSIVLLYFAWQCHIRFVSMSCQCFVESEVVWYICIIGSDYIIQFIWYYTIYIQ